MGRDSRAKLLKYGQEFPLSPPLRQLALLCAIMEIKCTEARNEGGRVGGAARSWVGVWGGGRRREGVRTSDLWSWGKLKVIKSEDYSTAKLLKFLREVEGFRPVLNSEALGGLAIYIIHNLFIFLSVCVLSVHPFLFYLQSFLSLLSSLLTATAELLLNSYSGGAFTPPVPPLSSLPPSSHCRRNSPIQRHNGKGGREGEKGESKRK